VSDTERVWITGGEFGGDKILYDEGSADAWRNHGYAVSGPFVQLAGTVKVLERIRDHADSAEAAAMLAQAELNRLGAL
jgi:hypothetical protein